MLEPGGTGQAGNRAAHSSAAIGAAIIGARRCDGVTS